MHGVTSTTFQKGGKPVRILVLSPHRDDACFSLALTLLRWVGDHREITVLNCFTRSNYAPLHNSPSSDIAELCSRISDLRRSEDERFARAVRGKRNADTSPQGRLALMDLSLADAPIRLSCSANDVCASWHSPDEDSVQRIRSAIEEFGSQGGEIAIALPAALGGHIDHRVVRHAAQTFCRSWPCAIYEDLPYAMRAGAADELERLLRNYHDTNGEPFCAELTQSASDGTLKRELCSIYASQINANEARAMAEFTGSNGGERIWTNRAWRSVLGAMPPHQRLVNGV